MKRIIIISIALLTLSLISCRSVRKITETTTRQSDSASYVRTETIHIDTIRIDADTASFSVDLSGDDDRVAVQEVKTEQGDHVSISYEVQHKEQGAVIKVRAVTRPVEVQQVTRTITERQVSVSTDSEMRVERKTVRKSLLVHLIWIIPLAVTGFIVYKKWPVIRAFIGI